jgi:hypothetical protein
LVLLSIVALFNVVAAQQPAAYFAGSDTVYWYAAGVPFHQRVYARPSGAHLTASGSARLERVGSGKGEYLLTVENLMPGQAVICVNAEYHGVRSRNCLLVVVMQPELRGGIDGWQGMHATVGRKYNPSSQWLSREIPDAHYQTVVEIDGRVVFDRPGTSFPDAELPAELMIEEGMKQVKTVVYWKPGGTDDRVQWVPLLSNFEPGIRIAPSRRELLIDYPAPEQVEGFEFDWMLTPEALKADFGPIVLRQTIGTGKYGGVQAAVNCPDCSEYGIVPRLVREDETRWSLRMEAADTDEHLREAAISGKRFALVIDMRGRGGSSGTGTVVVNVKLPAGSSR